MKPSNGSRAVGACGVVAVRVDEAIAVAETNQRGARLTAPQGASTVFPRVIMGSPEDSYGIVRLDQARTGTYGWQVRLQRAGVKYARYFADRGCGGPDKSLDQARVWRDELLARFSEQEGARVCRSSSRNSSGVVGVSRITVQVANGMSYHFWQAAWSPAPGQRRCIRFSIKRHGDKQAFRLAVDARREATGF